MIEPLTLEALAKADGGLVGHAVAEILELLRRDCMLRHAERKPRKMTLEVSVAPSENASPGPDGEIRVDWDVSIKPTLPPQRTVSYSAKATQQGLLFNDRSLDNVEQRTLDMTHSMRLTQPSTEDSDE